jgi:hypothetical protein
MYLYEWKVLSAFATLADGTEIKLETEKETGNNREEIKCYIPRGIKEQVIDITVECDLIGIPFEKLTFTGENDPVNINNSLQRIVVSKKSNKPNRREIMRCQ